MTDVQETKILDIQRDLEDLRRTSAALAGLMRDAQLVQAGTDRVTAHTRQQIVSMVQGLTDFSRRAEQVINDIKNASKNLEQDHDKHDEFLEHLSERVDRNNELFERLLGIQLESNPSPLKRQIEEILSTMRRIDGRSPATGEVENWTSTLGRHIANAFWSGVGAAVFYVVLRTLAPVILK